MKKQLALILSLTLAACTPALVDDNDLSKWDSNRDNRVSTQEFRDLDDGIFEDWDNDNDNIIETAELNEGVFGTLDRDNSGVLSSDEFGALDDWGFNEEFDAWDTDNDNWVNASEFGTGFDNEGLYADWDLNDDNRLDPNEYSDGLFNTWDANSDGYFDANEWDDADEAGLFDV